MVEIITKQTYTSNSRFIHPCLEPVDWLGRQLMRLTDFASCEFVKVFRRMRPGQCGQQSTVIAEVGMRMLHMALFISLLWSIVPYCIGGILRLSTSLFKRDFAYIHPDEAENRVFEQIKLCTFNTALGPAVMSAVNQIPSPEDRVDKMLEELLLRDDDVICLQECFDSACTEELVEGLKPRYPYIIFDVKSTNWGVGSGLVVASKIPMTAAHVEMFKERYGDEVLANKAYLCFTLNLGAGRYLNVLTTHLQSDFEGEAPTAEEVRLQQIEEIYQGACLYALQHPAMGFLATGDFNTVGDSLKNRVVVWRPCLHDSSLIREEDMWLSSPPSSWNVHEGQLVDHIGTFTGFSLPIPPLGCCVDAMGGTSDHKAIRATISLKVHVEGEVGACE